MKSQLFKKEIPKDLLYTLDKYAIDKDDYYLFTTISYQKAKFHKELEKFLDIIKEYYYPAKQSYITEKCHIIILQLFYDKYVNHH